MMSPKLGIKDDYELMLEKYSSGNMIGTSLRPTRVPAHLPNYISFLIFHKELRNKTIKPLSVNM